MSAPAASEARESAFATEYQDFLQAKVRLAPQDGFQVDPAEMNPQLKPHIQVAVRWGLAGGRRAAFLRFGMQKTTWHIEMMRLTRTRVAEPALIVMPLGARLSFFHDADKYFTGTHAVKLNFIRDDSEIDPAAINLTNVESVREGKIDPRRFGCTTFDEGDILRNMATKTFWTFTERAKQVRYRHVGTATPDPREYAELLAFAGYLDIMDVGQARTRFFKRNSEKADELTIHPHKEDEFWLWVASWALFLHRPSDLDASFGDDGYELPPLDVCWHEIASNHSTAGSERDGQLKLIKDVSLGVTGAAQEKRESLPARIARMQELRAELPEAHRIVWHDLEDERRAIEKAAPEIATVYGSQDLETRETRLVDFAEGRIGELAGKPVMIGSGPNFQYHCWWAIYLGVGWKFKDFIQSVHRLQRYGQSFEGFPDGKPKAVRLDIIHTEAEREVVRTLKENWKRYEEQSARMAALIREYGLARLAAGHILTRAMDVTREEVRGEAFTAVNNDCVDECRRLETDSVDLILTSLPFSTQYEYTPSYRDFGHTDDDPHFFAQMDFLTPELLRVLKPGRNCVIHCKDRIVEGARSGLGFPTVAPFGARTLFHFMSHGFAYIATVFIITDVVRENDQTYRLSFTEQCKDASKMGHGLIEYLHVFRKPQSDRGRGYADAPVTKLKRRWDRRRKQWIDENPWVKGEAAAADDPRMPYTVGRWQIDASGAWRSNGNRLLMPSELARLGVSGAMKRWKAHQLDAPYDYPHHLACADAMTETGTLKPDFAVIPIHSEHEDVWSDVVRMKSLNTLQQARNREKHLCPLPLDIVERAIAARSMPGEIVLDPFGGLMTVPYCALQLGRRAIGIELNAGYFKDGVSYCEMAERQATAPSLFDLLGEDDAVPEAAA
ncbi:MAG TPA: DNA methyltransferase [Rhizomicrobium sp.]|jgi:DNA modification methylase